MKFIRDDSIEIRIEQLEKIY